MVSGCKWFPCVDDGYDEEEAEEQEEEDVLEHQD